MERKHAIIIIKNEKNKYLQYYDNRWESYLFPNCKINHHYFYKCKIEKEFENRKIQFKWYSMEELLGDERIQMVNSDIVEYVKECDSKNNS